MTRFLRSAAMAVLALAVLGPGRAAQADFSACESALAASEPSERVELYTICLHRGGIGATDRSGAFNNRGVAYLALGQPDKALADFNAAIESDPKWGAGYVNRARIHAARREWALALADLDRAAKLPPSRDRGAIHVLRGHVLMAQGDRDGAMAEFQLGIKADPKTGYDSLAWLLATSPDASIRDGARAVELAQQALAKDDSPRVRDTLAAALAEAGRFDEAVQQETTAIQSLKGPDRRLSGTFESHLALYRAGRPYREAGGGASQR